MRGSQSNNYFLQSSVTDGSMKTVLRTHRGETTLPVQVLSVLFPLGSSFDTIPSSPLSHVGWLGSPLYPRRKVTSFNYRFLYDGESPEVGGLLHPLWPLCSEQNCQYLLAYNLCRVQLKTSIFQGNFRTHLGSAIQTSFHFQSFCFICNLKKPVSSNVGFKIWGCIF